MKWILKNALPGNAFGYQAPEIVDLNEDEGIIDISQHDGDVEIFSANEMFPSQIELRLKLSPVPFVRDYVRQILFNVDGVIYGPQKMYDEPINKLITGTNVSAKEAYYKAIDFLETGKGRYIYQGSEKYFTPNENPPFAILAPQKNRLYRKTFATIRNRFQVIEGESKKRFLMPYGGLFYPGISFENIQQIYCETIESQDNGFGLGFTNYHLWSKREIAPPHPGAFEGNEIHFVGDQPQSAHLGLGAALIAGEARFVVQHKEIPESRIYVSTSYSVPGNHPDFVDVTFVQNGFNF